MVANVFSYDAEKLANRRGMRHGVILGHLAAHELGHLLLGVGSHSPHGIMHVPWRLKELDVIVQGLLVFTPQQAESMRTNIRARVAVERSAENTEAELSGARDPQVTVKVYNSAHVSVRDLAKAEAQATGTFWKVGIKGLVTFATRAIAGDL